jgi:hypothetical protein
VSAEGTVPRIRTNVKKRGEAHIPCPIFLAKGTTGQGGKKVAFRLALVFGAGPYCIIFLINDGIRRGVLAAWCCTERSNNLQRAEAWPRSDLDCTMIDLIERSKLKQHEAMATHPVQDYQTKIVRKNRLFRALELASLQISRASRNQESFGLEVSSGLRRVVFRTRRAFSAMRIVYIEVIP